MKNSDLDQLLKSVPVPERAQGYWEAFPRRVMAKTHWLDASAQAEAGRSRTDSYGPLYRLRFATFGVGLVVIGLLLSFVFAFRQGPSPAITDSQLATAQKYFHEIETLFPNQVQAIVFDQQGAHLVLAERPNVPASAPLYLRISGPKGIQNYVTFSGQQIRFNGEVCEVLIDHEGNALLVGQQRVWSSAQADTKKAGYRVAARPLEATL